MNPIWRRIASCILWLGLTSCKDEIAVIGHIRVVRDAGGAAKESDAAVSGTDAGAGSAASGDALAIEPGPRALFCAGSGPALRVVSAGSTGPVCTPGIGRRLFRYGLCTCNDLSVAQPLSTFTLDAFDSRNGSYDMGETGAALGVDGTMHLANVAIGVSGTGIVAGGGELLLGNTLSVNFSADFKTNASIDTTGGGVFHVGRDLWSDGNIYPSLTTNVTRDVYQTPGHTGAETIVGVSGSRQTRSFTVEPPCACGQGRALDIAALVTEAQRTNDNAELGFSADALSDMLQQRMVLDALACGRFLVSGLSLPGGVLRTLTGRLALFVAGDLTLQGDIASDLTAEAELDVFVSGNLIVQGPAQIGMPERPSAVRLFIAGSGAIELSDRVNVAAQMYAPHAPVNVTVPVLGTVVSYGSIVAANVDVAAFFTLHYDRAVAELGERCDGAPPARCDSCEQCPFGLACVDGACAACRTDADCCEPFGCTDGKCQPLIYTAPMP